MTVDIDFCQLAFDFDHTDVSGIHRKQVNRSEQSDEGPSTLLERDYS